MWRYGPWAVVVGASDGIGAAFAERLARRGSNLVLVARRPAPLAELADRLRAGHGVAVRVEALDAGTPDGIAAIAAAPEDVGLLVCNAALAPIGPFLAQSTARLDAVLDLNCRCATHLAHAFGQRMAARGSGGIVLLSSLAGNQGSALVAQYAATKAYLRVLAEGLWAELRESGIDVLACCPGLVRTPTLERSGPAPVGGLLPPSRPQEVARVALAALGRRPVVIPGRLNLLAASAARLLSRRRLAALASARTRGLWPAGRPGDPTEPRRWAPADEPGE